MKEITQWRYSIIMGRKTVLSRSVCLFFFFPNMIYSFNTILIKMSASYKFILIFIWKDLE